MICLRLLSSQIRGVSSGKKMLFCYRCQKVFTDEEKLKNHLIVCSDITLLQLPDSSNNIIEDKEVKEIPPCMSVYADFESLVVPCSPEEIKKGKYQKHIPACWCFFLKSYTYIFKSCSKSQVLKEGDNIVKNFVSSLMFTIRVNIEKFKKETNTIATHTPVFFHNLTGYDAHLFIIELAEYGFGRLTVIPSSEKNYISFSKIFQNFNCKW